MRKIQPPKDFSVMTKPGSARCWRTYKTPGPDLKSCSSLTKFVFWSNL